MWITLGQKSRGKFIANIDLLLNCLILFLPTRSNLVSRDVPPIRILGYALNDIVGLALCFERMRITSLFLGVNLGRG